MTNSAKENENVTWERKQSICPPSRVEKNCAHAGSVWEAVDKEHHPRRRAIRRKEPYPVNERIYGGIS